MKRDSSILFLYILSVCVFLCTASCTKFVEVDPPPTSFSSDNVFNDDATAAAALTGIYGTIDANSFNNPGINSLSLFLGLSADELTLFPASIDVNLAQYYKNQLTATTPTFWSSTYNLIFASNLAIDGLTKSTTLTSSLQTQLIAESKFVRAFCYYYLANLFDRVPLVVNTDYNSTARLGQSSKAQVLEQVIVDLLAGEAGLSDKYLKGNASTPYEPGTEERVRPTRWAAKALLARIYLEKGDWANAEKFSSEVIGNSNYELVPIGDAFLKNNKEAIWQLQPSVAGWNTQDARIFILPETGPANATPVYLSKFLLDSFEVNDMRRIEWIDSAVVSNDTFYYPAKYKSNVNGAPITEYLTVLRLAEQFLIRAEARLRQNNADGAKSDINAIRERAGLGPIATSDNGKLLQSIIQERHVELFTEWGHRWIDLKQYGRIDQIMSAVVPVKAPSTSWKSFQQWLPISVGDIQRNRNLLQNPGY